MGNAPNENPNFTNDTVPEPTVEQTAEKTAKQLAALRQAASAKPEAQTVTESHVQSEGVAAQVSIKERKQLARQILAQVRESQTPGQASA